MTVFSIIGGRVIDPANGLDAVTDLHIANGKILAIGPKPADFTAQWQIDAKNQIVCPGLVDLCARLREPGAEHKGTVLSETRAAANNGITTLCCPPDTNPVIDTPAVVELLLQRAVTSGMAKVLPLAALTQGLQGKQLTEMGTLKEVGCVGVSNALEPVINTDVLRYALEYAANCDLTVFFHPQDSWLGRNGCMHEGATSTRLGLMGIPETTETIAVARDLLLIEMTGVRAHFCRLSTARAVELIQHAKSKGLSVTADVSAHQLFLTDTDVGNYNSHCHVYPPLRSHLDKETLRIGLRNGVITAICSDHQPHEDDAKLSPFAQAAPGISGLDTLLPLTLRLAEELQLDLATALNYVTYKPAQILGITAGTLSPGQVADICIINPNKLWSLYANDMHSLGHNSPFLGWEFKGQVSYTLINGQVVYACC
ncbi:MAG: dihydroorotase [Beggiatoa sp. IS2]|nr:MAG: dihydroorotase [Beggiatoa sp. IS2]